MIKDKFSVIDLEKFENSPSSRYGHTSTIVDSQIYIFGGLSMDGKSFHNDLHVFDHSKMKWMSMSTSTQNEIISGRHFHTCCLYRKDEKNPVLLFFGGKSNGYFNDVFYYSIKDKKFEPIKPKYRVKKKSSCVNKDVMPPSERYGHSACCYQHKMFIFGGYDKNGFTKNDLFSFDLEKNEWKKIAISKKIPRRYLHSGVLLRDSYFIIGGVQGDYSSLSDVYRLDFLNDGEDVEVFQLKIDRPVASYGHQCFLLDQKIIMLGGRTQKKEFKHMLKLENGSSGNLSWDRMILFHDDDDNVESEGEVEEERIFSKVFKSSYSSLNFLFEPLHHHHKLLIFGGQSRKKKTSTTTTSKHNENILISIDYPSSSEEEEENEGEEEEDQMIMNTLPLDCIHHMFSYLHTKDILQLAWTSKTFPLSMVARSDRLWESLYRLELIRIQDLGILTATAMREVRLLTRAYEKYKGLRKHEFMFHDFITNQQHELSFDFSKMQWGKYVDGESNVSVKCVIVGDGACGKTCLLIRAASGTWPTEYIPTVFDNWNTEFGLFKESHCELGLWDTAGEEDYDELRPLSYTGADVFLVCFSVVDPVSFSNIATKWVPEIKRHCPKARMVLVGTKLDLRDDPRILEQLSDSGQQPIFTEEGLRLAKKIKAVRYVETSAKNDVNVCRGRVLFKLICAAAIAPAELKGGGKGGICGVM